MFKTKKDYTKKKYKDVPKLNIGDVNRILQASRSEEDKFRMFASLFTQAKLPQQETHVNNIQEVLQNNVMHLVRVHGDADINLEALEKRYKGAAESVSAEQFIVGLELEAIQIQDAELVLQHVQGTLDKYEHQLNVLQTKLAKNIFSNYSTYLEALETIDEIGDTSSHSLEKVKYLREQIQQGKQAITAKGINILQKRIQISNHQQTLELLLKMKEQYLLPYQVYVDSLNNGYIDAEHYLTLLKNQDFLQLSILPKNHIAERIQFVKQLTYKGIMNQFNSFDQRKYEIQLKSYRYLESQGELPQYITEAPNIISRAYENQITKVLKSISDSLGIDFYFETLADSLNQIPPDSLIEFYRELLQQTVTFMMNLHLCQRFHLKSDLEVGMLELRKKFVDQLCNKLEEIIALTTQWHKMRKEEIVCFFGLMSIFVAKCESYNGQQQKRFKDFLRARFGQFLEARGCFKLIKEWVSAEDCKKCLKVTLNQTQQVLSLATHVRYQIFDFTDPFPQVLNVFKPQEFKRVLDLFQDQGMTFKKQPNANIIIYNGKERNLLLTYTVNQIYYLMQSQLLFMLFCKEERQRLFKEFQFIVQYYVCNILFGMVNDHYKKLLQEDSLQLNFDSKQEAENYFNQFDLNSEIIIFREGHLELCKFYKEASSSIPEEMQIKKTEQFELGERIVFVESLFFLTTELKEIIAYLPEFNGLFLQLQSIVYMIQNVVYRSAIPDMTSLLLNVKYEIKVNEKDDPVRQQVIDRMIGYFDMKISGLTAQQLSEFQKCLADGMLYQLLETYSKVKKVTNLGREMMLADFQKLEKAINYENPVYESYIKIFNQIQQDVILDYIYQSQKIFPFKMLLSLFNSAILQNLKRQAKKECYLKMFQIYAS